MVDRGAGSMRADQADETVWGRPMIGRRSSRPYHLTPTRYGVVFLVVLTGMLLGSTNYHSNLGLAMTFLLGSMALVSIVHTIRNFRGIEILAGRTENVFAGNDALVEVIVPAGPWPRRVIRLQLENGAPLVFDLDPEQEARLGLTVRTTTRGPLDPGDLYLWTEYPYGLFRCGARKRLPVTAWVYPRPVAGPFFSQKRDNGAQGRVADSPGMDDFKGLRPYRPGDTPRRIAWKSAAKGNGLLTKEFEGSGGGQALIFDWEIIEPGNAEFKLSRLCHQVLTAHHQNLRYGLDLPGVFVPPSTGEDHRRQCLETLAGYVERETAA